MTIINAAEICTRCRRIPCTCGMSDTAFRRERDAILSRVGRRLVSTLRTVSGAHWPNLKRVGARHIATEQAYRHAKWKFTFGGASNGYVLRKIDDAVLDDLTSWPGARPSVYLSDGCIVVEAAWPGHLQIADVPLSSLGNAPRTGEHIIIGPNDHGETIRIRARDIVHQFIAGQTRCGKSWLERLFAYQIAHNPKAKIVFIDGKGGATYGILNGVPGQVGPIAYLPEDTTRALSWSVAEMDKRYTQMRNAGGIDISATWPDVWVFISEFVFLIDADQQHVSKEQAKANSALMDRLIKQGGEARIHLIASTQVLYKSTLPDGARGQFTTAFCGIVNDEQESKAGLLGRTEPRADKMLQGNGDFIVIDKSRGRHMVARLQAAYVTESEMKSLAGGQPKMDDWPDVSGDERQALVEGKFDAQRAAWSIARAEAKEAAQNDKSDRRKFGREWLQGLMSADGCPVPGSTPARDLIRFGEEVVNQLPRIREEVRKDKEAM